jgi:hypothetical protein
LIDYLPSLKHPAIHHSCFISYSSEDEDFAKRLYKDLLDRGVQCWFAPHDLPIGAKTWDAIDKAIELKDKLLLILSENSLASDWVEDEVSKAYAEERARSQVVLFPIRIDDAVMKTDEAWAVKLRDQRHIGIFVSGKRTTSTRRLLNGYCEICACQRLWARSQARGQPPKPLDREAFFIVACETRF